MNEKDIIRNYLRTLNIIVSVSLATLGERPIVFILKCSAEKSNALKDITLDNIVGYSIDFFKDRFEGMSHDKVIQEFDKFINDILDSIKLLTGNIILNKINLIIENEGLNIKSQK